MSEVARIQDQLKRAFEEGAWHGPSVREVLAGVTAAKAVAKPMPNAHSIWEIVHHVTAWEYGVRRRIEGEKVEMTPEQDWPPVTDTSEATWNDALADLEKGYQQLQAAILRLDDSQLDHLPPDSRSSIYMHLHGTIQHH